MTTDERIAVWLGQAQGDARATARGRHRWNGSVRALFVAFTLALVGSLAGAQAAGAVTGTASISGTVTKAKGGAPVAAMEVCAARMLSGGKFELPEPCALTDSEGNYTESGLPAGEYRVEFSGYICAVETECVHRYESQSWHDERGFEEGDTITLSSGEALSSIDASVAPGGGISGTVRSGSNSGPPIANILVCSLEEVPSHKFEQICSFTNAGGEYEIEGLAPGPAFVEFSGVVCSVAEETCSPTYSPQYYNGKATLPEANAVSVVEGKLATEIDAALSEPAPELPVNLQPPKVMGAPAVGATLLCSEGLWANEPSSLEYAWLVNGTLVPGASSSSLLVSSGDEGRAISCQVTARNSAGAASAESGAVIVPMKATTTTTTTSSAANPPAQSSTSSGGSTAAVAARTAPVRGADAVITVHCNNSEGCEGKFKLVAQVPGRSGGRHGRHGHSRNVVIGTTSFVFLERGQETVEVHLTAEGQNLVNHAGAGGVKVRLTGSGIQARTVVLRRSHARAHTGSRRLAVARAAMAHSAWVARRP